MKRPLIAVTFLFLASVGLLFAQTGGRSPGGAQSTSTASSTSSSDPKALQQNLEEILSEPVQGESYHYDSQGRRDPFRSLIGPSSNRRVGGPKPEGIPGFLVDEIDLTGVVRTKQGLVAMITGPDNKGYLLHVSEKVFDGEVVRISNTGIVFRQEVNDPTSIERFKEVVKELTPQSGKKTP